MFYHSKIRYAIVTYKEGKSFFNVARAELICFIISGLRYLFKKNTSHPESQLVAPLSPIKDMTHIHCYKLMII